MNAPILPTDRELQALAQPWLDASAGCRVRPAAPPTTAEQVALAWALKNACYAAWSSEPDRVANAAGALARLAASTGEAQVLALAEWGGAIAALVRGEMELAICKLEKARARFEADDLPGVAAQTEVPRVMALAMLGRHEEALHRASAALTQLKSAGDLRTAGKLAVNLGSMYLRRDEYQDAARHYREASVLMARVGDRETSVMADVGMADALTWLGDFDEAERLYDRASMRARTHGFPVLHAIVDGSVGWLELSRGRHQRALKALESSCRQFDELAMPQRLAIAEQHLGDAYLEVHLLQEAIAQYERAIETFTRQESPDDLAWTRAQLGRALTLAGRFEEAADVLAAAARGYATLDNRAGAGAVCLWQAELALQRGRALDSKALAMAAAKALGAAGLDRWRDMAQTVSAEASLAANDTGEATRLFADILSRQSSPANGTHLVRCHTGLGLAAHAEGNDDEACAYLEKAMCLGEQQRAALPAGELRIAFQAQMMRPYEAMLAQRLARPQAGQADEVLMLMERYRARALLELAGRPDGADNDPALALLRDRVRWLHRHLQRVDAVPGENASLRERLSTLEVELLEALRRRRLAASDASDLADWRPPERDALVRVLGNETTIIEYGQSGGELFACTVSAEGVKLWRDLARGADWAAVLNKARFQIDTLRHGPERLRAHDEVLQERALRHLQQLHALIWQPLERAIGPRRQVVVVPHGALHYVPFAALHDGRGYLVEHHDISIVPSLGAALRRWDHAVVTSCRVSAFGFDSGLAHAEEEARRIGALFSDARVATGDEATSGALRDAAGDSDLLHLACHAQFRPDSPMFSTLSLADGPLALLDLQTLSMAPAIVVLSGCETGVGSVSRGNDLTGLVHTFLQAGAARVVASQWPVDDAASADLMTAFYGALADGDKTSAALAKAQRGSLAQRQHPFYWAAFCVHGGP